MKYRLSLAAVTVVLLTHSLLFAQTPASTDTTFSEASPDVSFWVNYWGKPKISFGAEEEAFNSSVHEVDFPLDVFDQPLNANVLDDNAQWLKAHTGDRFYIEGYASADGELGYNLSLSKRRADWVKQTLLSKGVAENQIVLASPWGELYPTCPGLDQDCLSRNRLVRFVYSPN